jgi:hypothetical protein
MNIRIYEIETGECETCREEQESCSRCETLLVSDEDFATGQCADCLDNVLLGFRR